MKLYCGNRLTEVKMYNWTGNGYTPDWSNDFFGAGELRYNAALDAYEVEDIDYCIDQANDWKNNKGDYEGDHTDRLEDRFVDVYELDLPPITKSGEFVAVGEWLSDTTGVYEVKEVTPDKVYLKEVCFTGDGDEYELGDDVIFTREEVRRMEVN